MASKTAVVLLNLGCPHKPEDINPFLRNFFSDPAIIRLPYILRKPIANFIAQRRAKGAARNAYSHIGGASPLLKNTQAQAHALQKALGDKYKTFVCMRYWHPMAREVAQQIGEWGADNVVLLPMYPQFASSTTASAFKDWEENGNKLPTIKIKDYHNNAGFIDACSDIVKSSVKGAKSRVLFCAHGLPVSEIKRGDPYQNQCEETAQLIAQRLGLSDWQVCYQSRVGFMKWLEPSIDQALERAAADNVGVVVFPHSFTQEHVETLVELDIEYKEKARELKVPHFIRAPAVGCHEVFINALADLVRAGVLFP